jgi:mRNA interferase MazF
LPFPFTDLSDARRRPALVISPDWYNKSFDDVVVLAITSRVPKRIGRLEIGIAQRDIDSGALPKPSVVKVSKIFTCHSTLVIKEVCRLKEEKTNQVLFALWRFLGDSAPPL